MGFGSYDVAGPSVQVNHSFCQDFCRVPQPTLWREGDAGLTGASSKGGRCAESPPTFIRGKRQKNRKAGLWTLSVKGSEVVYMHGEGISTPRVRHKGRKPLIKCARHDFKIMYFPFFMFFIFLWSTRVFPSLLRIFNCVEEIRPT